MLNSELTHFRPMSSFILPETPKKPKKILLKNPVDLDANVTFKGALMQI